MPLSILKLAKSTIETYLKTGKKIKPPQPLPKIFQKKAGVFVSLHKPARRSAPSLKLWSVSDLGVGRELLSTKKIRIERNPDKCREQMRPPKNMLGW